MITQDLYPINPPCLYVTVISIYRKKKIRALPSRPIFAQIQQ